jgi:hypothetical protein
LFSASPPFLKDMRNISSLYSEFGEGLSKVLIFVMQKRVFLVGMEDPIVTNLDSRLRRKTNYKTSTMTTKVMAGYSFWDWPFCLSLLSVPPKKVMTTMIQQIRTTPKNSFYELYCPRCGHFLSLHSL